MEIVRVTSSTNAASQRVGCGLASLCAAASTWYAVSAEESMFWIVAGFWAVAASMSILGIVCPKKLEFVVELHGLRFGPAGGCRTLLRSDISELRFEAGTDHDLAVAIMKDGSSVSIPNQIIGARQGDLARRVAEVWPDVEIWLREVPMTSPHRVR